MLFSVSSAIVSFDPISYTVTEGVDKFVVLGLARSGDISGSTTVTITPQSATAMGMVKTHGQYNYYYRQ